MTPNDRLRLDLALSNFDEWCYRINGSMGGTVWPIYTNCQPLITLVDVVRQIVRAGDGQEPT